MHTAPKQLACSPLIHTTHACSPYTAFYNLLVHTSHPHLSCPGARPAQQSTLHSHLPKGYSHRLFELYADTAVVGCSRADCNAVFSLQTCLHTLSYSSAALPTIACLPTNACLYYSIYYAMLYYILCYTILYAIYYAILYYMLYTILYAIYYRMPILLTIACLVWEQALSLRNVHSLL